MSDARVTAVAEQILDAFRTGTAPAALRLVLIQRNPNLPSSAWSIRNRFIAALAGIAVAAPQAVPAQGKALD